jgi:hypothetical protein
MTSNNADYVESLEARIDEYEKQMARSVPLGGKDFDFIQYAKRRHAMRSCIATEDMDMYFSDASPVSFIRKVYIAICTFIRNCIEWFREYWTLLLVITLCSLLIICGIMGTLTETLKKDISEKIEQSIRFDLNNDNIVTDDERRTVIAKFIADNKLKINEEDLYECIRNKKFDGFYNREKKLTVDEVYDLITKKDVEKRPQHLPSIGK